MQQEMAGGGRSCRHGEGRGSLWQGGGRAGGRDCGGGDRRRSWRYERNSSDCKIPADLAVSCCLILENPSACTV